MSAQLSFASDFHKQWKRIQEALEGQYGRAVAASWFQSIVVGPLEGHTLTLYVPNPFFRDWVRTHYHEKIEHYWSEVNQDVRYVDFQVAEMPEDENASVPVMSPSPAPIKNEVGFVRAAGEDSSSEWSSYHAPVLDPRLTFEHFIVGKPNELAYAAAQRVAESDRVAFNPLFLYGGVGLGKTHLMHAIAWHIRQNFPQRRVLYLSAEKFMYQFVRALRQRETLSFKEYFRSVDVLMVDDVQFICGKDSTQEEFFHTFNALVEQRKQVILSADKSPSDLDGLEERLKSRLSWGLIADVHPTNYELRLGILQNLMQRDHVPVTAKVLELLASKITSNVRELEGAFVSLVTHAQLMNREVTMDFTRQTLSDLFRSHDKRLTVDAIQQRVAEYFGVRPSELCSSRRLRVLVRPRQVAMYLCKKLTSLSLPDIGRQFGGRDHTTVLHAVAKVKDLIQQDSQFSQDLSTLERSLVGSF